MKADIRIVATNLKPLNAVSGTGTCKHVEFDKVVISLETEDRQSVEFELWHRNIIFEAESIRLRGFSLVNGTMGTTECLLTPIQEL